MADSLIRVSDIECVISEDRETAEKCAVYHPKEKELRITPLFTHSAYALYNLASAVALSQLESEGKVDSTEARKYIADCIGYMICRKNGYSVTEAAFDCVPPQGFADRETKMIKGDLDTMRNTFRDIYGRMTEEIEIRRQKSRKEYEIC